MEKLSGLFLRVLNGKASPRTLALIEQTAEVIEDSSDCAIGYDAARMVLTGVRVFREDFLEHIANARCTEPTKIPVPCNSYCPANVDVPGYIALVGENRCADAVRLIRKDNPFPATCGYICEHPCEHHCRRGMMDDAVNIRGMKRYAVDTAGIVPAPECAPPTGKTVAVIGGGPAGLTAAYYLALMGHSVTVFERRKKLGGMLRYGIPAYRFPREFLDQDIECIASTGIEIKTGTSVGEDVEFDTVVNDYDSVFISVGAQGTGVIGIPGETFNGVVSAIDLLRGIGDGVYPSFEGKTVVVVGGGNVAMDATRTSIRLGAKKIYCVYRRRRNDMTALLEEVEGAIAEGCELLTLKSPVYVEGDDNDNAVALWVKTQLPGVLSKDGRPKPVDADLPMERIAADLVIMAVGQKIESSLYEKAGIPTDSGALVAMANGQILENGKLFAGGDCSTNPATAIRAIAAGKVAAANIDEFLGFNHEISVDADIPPAIFCNHIRRGRVDATTRKSYERKNDFECIENRLSEQGAVMEASRCLRCDYFGYGGFRGGRTFKW